MKLRIITCWMLLTTAVTPARATDVQTLLSKALAIRNGGLAAMFSSDGRFVSDEVRKTTAALRADRLTQEAAGEKGAYCPPPTGGRLEMDDIFAALEAVPSAQRRATDVKEAFRAALARKFPCNSH